MTTLPIIHLNGTGAQSLFDEYYEAVRAARKLRVAICQATVHERDFYLHQSEEAWKDARFERAEIFAKLGDIEDYLNDWVEFASNHIK